MRMLTQTKDCGFDDRQVMKTSSSDYFGVPYGNRTRVAAVKGRCPRPLDERDADGELFVLYGKRVTLTYRV